MANPGGFETNNAGGTGNGNSGSSGGTGNSGSSGGTGNVDTTSGSARSFADILAGSSWFALATGIASFISLLLALYGTQVRALPVSSLYRSLVWQRMLLLAFGGGAFVASSVGFYYQEPPSNSLDFTAALFLIHAVLHGGHEVPGSGTLVWSLMWATSVPLILFGLRYDPLKSMMRTVRDQENEISKAEEAALAELPNGDSEASPVAARTRDSQRSVQWFYGELRYRLLDVTTGTPPYQRSMLAPVPWQTARPEVPTPTGESGVDNQSLVALTEHLAGLGRVALQVARVQQETSETLGAIREELNVILPVAEESRRTNRNAEEAVTTMTQLATQASEAVSQNAAALAEIKALCRSVTQSIPGTEPASLEHSPDQAERGILTAPSTEARR